MSTFVSAFIVQSHFSEILSTDWLTVRGDLSKTEAKDLVPDVSNTRAPKTRSIFSQVQVSAASAAMDSSAVSGASSAVRGAVERAVERTKEVAPKNLNPFGPDF